MLFKLPPSIREKIYNDDCPGDNASIEVNLLYFISDINKYLSWPPKISFSFFFFFFLIIEGCCIRS